jgi:MFS family permease
MTTVETDRISTDIPARLDRLPWARWHWLVVIGLGTVWILDGLEVTIVGSMSDALKPSDTGLGLSSFQVGFAGAAYVAGACLGALFFGQLTDRFGRKKLFLITLGVYTVATVLTAFSMNPAWYFACRFLTGTGIGGEYAAINSAIDELIPARHRGHTDLAINGTYWLGALIAASSQFVLLNPDILPVDLGWRIGFLIGPVIGLAIWRMRRHLPESPRWQLMHGRHEAAEATVATIEKDFTDRGIQLEEVDDSEAIEVVRTDHVGFAQIARTLFRDYPKRTVVGFALGISQSFLYNAIFFTYVLVLTDFYGVDASTAAAYLIPFAIGNLLGPILLGRLFDTIGRKPMIAGTYAISGVLLAITGYLFSIDALTAFTQTVLWCVIFFFASAAASSAYLTVSEVFPLELRAQAIAFFFSVWQLVGGVIAPWVFGTLIGTGDRGLLFVGYLVGAGLMVGAAIIQLLFGVEAARRSLEDVARPLSAVRGTGAHPREG